jgi:hypothetical protein
VDWVDFIRFDGITYLASTTQAGNKLTADSLGPKYASIEFMVSGSDSGPDYQSKDGDAAFLPAATPVYIVRGYRPEFRLAARRDGHIVVYEADTNPQATRGEDLLDLAGKVAYIGVNSDQDGVTELASITDARQVSDMVQMVLEAPVSTAELPPDSHGSEPAHDEVTPGPIDSTPGETLATEAPVSPSQSPLAERDYFVAFHLLDGTIVTRKYFAATGELQRGIHLPDAFGQMLLTALQAQ